MTTASGRGGSDEGTAWRLVGRRPHRRKGRPAPVMAIGAIDIIDKKHFISMRSPRLLGSYRDDPRAIERRTTPMRIERRLSPLLFVLLFPGQQTSASLAAAETQGADRTVGTASRSVPAQSKPWPAPVGHRQPRAADIPPDVPKNASDERLRRLNRELEPKLQICRGC